MNRFSFARCDRAGSAETQGTTVHPHSFFVAPAALQAARVVAIRPVRAASETAVSAHSGFQPTVADGTAVQRLAAVAATVGAAILDRQSDSALIGA